MQCPQHYSSLTENGAFDLY